MAVVTITNQLVHLWKAPHKNQYPGLIKYPDYKTALLKIEMTCSAIEDGIVDGDAGAKYQFQKDGVIIGIEARFRKLIHDATSEAEGSMEIYLNNYRHGAISWEHGVADPQLGHWKEQRWNPMTPITEEDLIKINMAVFNRVATLTVATGLVMITWVEK